MQFSQIAIRGCAMGLVAVSMLLAGCSSVPLDESAKVGTTQDDAATKHRSASGAALDRNAVYFDFDSYTVKPEFMPVVETHARNLMANPSQHVTVEGNTDNRGSREYNLALGQKRSEAVKQSVVQNGAVYLAAIGGAGALMADSVQSCEVIAWPDLGCEAVRRLIVRDFPLTVLLDAHGGDLYQSGPAAYLAARENRR